MRGEVRKTKVGRPRLGKAVRVRVSFTLAPEQINWLKRRAGTTHKSRSEILSELIELQPTTGASKLPTDAAVPIPYPALERFCKKHCIARLSLFGSVVDPSRFNSESDIDVLVEFETDAAPTLFQMAAMSQELEHIFAGREIDLVTLQDLSVEMRLGVLQEARLIYAKI